LAYERDTYSPRKTLRAEIGGFSFRLSHFVLPICVDRVEESRDENHTIKINGSPRHAAKTKGEPPA
jgi:hypothetical protein